MFMNLIRQSTTNLKLKLFILLALAIFLQGTACSKTVSICNRGCDFTSITEGINSADRGDTIEVQSGTYFENVNVSKPLTLLGKDTGQGKPIIDAGGNGSAMTLFADDTTVKGFNLTNSLGSWLEIWAGIEVNSNHSTLIDIMAFNNENGILITGSNNTIQGNDAINNIYGIKTKSSANNFITGNNLRNNNYGLFILDSRDNAIQRNQATNNEYGILLNESTENNLSHNQMTGNSYNFGGSGVNYVDTTNFVDGRPIYYLMQSAGLPVDSFHDAGTIYCLNCYNLTIRDLELKNNLYGIYLDNTSHSIIEDNILSNNRNGIALMNSNRNSIKDNLATDNTEGFVLISSRYNTLQRNKALKSQASMHLTYSDYNRVLNNLANDSENGLWLVQSGLNLLSGNNLSYNSIGAHLSFAWMNKIFYNNISSNDEGILLDSSANNNLSGNRIMNNTNGVLYDPLDNNTLGSDNEYLNNGADFEQIRSRFTADPGNPPSIAIQIKSNPNGAAILKDGELSGETNGPVYFTEPGKYTLLVKKEGYEDGELTIEIPGPDRISAGIPRERSIELKPEENSTNGG